MGGPKLNYSAEQKDENRRHREPLNSTNRKGTGGAVKRFFHRAIFVASFMGAIMGEPAMKEAHAQESRVDVRAVQQAYENLTTHFTAIRGTFTQMQEAGITPVQVTYTDANVRRLLAALVQLDQRLRPSNGGQAVIPISGSTDRDKFRSMNTWLGRGRDAALDAAGLQLLEQRVMAALGTPSADSSVGPVLAQATPQPTVAPAPVAAPTERPSARETVPARVEAQPEPAVAAAPQHGQLRDNLEVISNYGRNAGVRRSAEQALTRLNAELNRTGGPRERQLARLVTAAERVVSSELARSQTRAAQARMTDIPGVDTAAAHPLSQRVTSILTDLQAVAADQSVSQERRNLANNLIGRLNDALLLGESPASRMVTRIGEARDAIRAGNETLAREKLTAANTIFTQEQQLMRQRLEQFVVPIAQASLQAIDGSHLPTRAEVAAAARADGQSRGTYDYVPVRNADGTRVLRRVRTGREDIRSSMEERLTRARQVLQGAQGGGSLSYHLVNELYESVVSEEQVIRAVVDLWEFTRGQNIAGLDTPRRIQLRTAYANAVSTLLDSDFIPYRLYTAGTRRSMARAYLRHTGVPITDAQVRRAETELLPALMRNRDFRYEDVLHKLYLEVSRLAPAAPSAVSSSIRTMATMRRLRPNIRYEYARYRLALDMAAYPPQPLSEAELQGTARLTLARSSLQEVVTGSGLPATDPMIQAANAWITASQGTVDVAQVPQMSDTLYYMALSLASIREAQLWRSTSSIRANLSQERLGRADAMIQQAQQAFVWCFSSPQVDSGFHPNISGAIADAAINALAPATFRVLESPATIATNQAYASPSSQEVTVADIANPTDAERAQAAQLAEERFLRLLVGVRGTPRFAVSAYGSRDAASRRAFALLQPSVGRNPTEPIQRGGHPILRGSTGRGRTSVSEVDQHIVPEPNTGGDANLGSNPQEDMRIAQYGSLYIELYRLAILRGNGQTPQWLRTIDPAPLRSRMWQISQGYATATPTETLASANGQLISILDTRLGELRTRLDGEIAVASGTRFARRDLARSRDPRVMYVTRAVEAERLLTTLRGALHRDRGSDLFTGRMNPRLAIATAELAIASLDDSILSRFPDPEQQGRLTDDLAQLSFYVPRTSIEQERYSRGSSSRVRFTAEQVMVREADGDTMSFADFHRRYQRQHQRTVNLTYYWFVYQNLGRRDQDGQITQYLRNPQYDPTSTIEARRRSHIGQVINNVTLTDGTVIPRAVVRVRPSGESPTSGREWVPVMDGRQRVRPSDVLFRIEGTSGFEPVRDERFRRNMESVCAPTDHNQSWTYVVGESTPVVIVSPRSTSPTAAARRSR